MLRFRFKGTVTLVKSVGCVRLQSWRHDRQVKRTSVQLIPYDLATYLCLMPTNGLKFSTKLYNFSHKDFDDFTCHADGVVTKATRRGNKLILTLDLSGV